MRAPMHLVTRAARHARLHHLPILLAKRAVPLTLGTVTMAVVQAVLGAPRRWKALQLLVAAAAAGTPGLALLRPLAAPLLCSWVYGLGSRIWAPAHARSLRFWKKVVPIYMGYKSTQTSLAVRNTSAEQREKAWNKRHEWGADKVYKLCVEMRGFYLKDGQFLGARSDLVPPAWCKSLQRLQDRVPPVPFTQIEKALQDAYRINRITQLYKSIDPTPLASATIAQVHRGEMRDGTQIVLKAQYVDQEQLCAMDLLNLKRLAGFLQKHDMSFFDMNAVVEEFENQLPTEFDFLREAEMMTSIRLNLRNAGIKDIVIPRVIPGLVTRRALTMTFVDGCRADDVATMRKWGINAKQVIRTIGRAYGQMLLCDGVAHCDPHLGNIFLLRDKRVALIDFGQSKVLSEELRRKLCAFYLALNSKNKYFIMKTFGDLGIELDIRPEDITEEFIEMVPVYANGLLDTAPLPLDVEINPFSEASPLKQVPIKRFNPDLFMVLRALGLLRSLTKTLRVEGTECCMSAIFKPFAQRGYKITGPSESETKRKRMVLRSALTSAASSPFDPPDVTEGDYCMIS